MTSPIGPARSTPPQPCSTDGAPGLVDYALLGILVVLVATSVAILAVGAEDPALVLGAALIGGLLSVVLLACAALSSRVRA